MRPAIYVRVSSRTQADDGFSLDAQERICRDYCKGEGWGEPIVFADAGRSAFSDSIRKRPAFGRLLAAAEAREFDVVVCHRLDRFARHQETAFREFRRLHEAGVLFVSVSERGYDFTTPIGRLFFGLLSGIAEYFSSNLAIEVRKGQAQRTLAGYPRQQRPFGAMPTPDGMAWLVDPRHEATLARLLDLAATRSYDHTANLLNEEGLPTKRGNPWTGITVARVVKGGGWLSQQPPPWPERYAAAAARLPLPHVRAGNATRMLTGLGRCGHCGGLLTYSRLRDGYLALRCHRPGARGCLPGSPRRTNAGHYEALVVAEVAKLPPAPALLRAAARLAGQADPHRAERAAIEEARRQLRVDLRLRLVSEEDATIEAEALTAREAALPGLSRTERDVRDLIATIATFPTLPPALQNAQLRLLYAEVTITGVTATCVPSPLLAELQAEVDRLSAAA